MKTRSFVAAISLLLTAVATLTLAGDEVSQWLERMSIAMSQMDYQGTFVYVLGGDVESMRVTHVVDELGARERLVSVSGEPREVIRDANGMRWLMGDDGTIMANSDTDHSFFPELPLGDPSQAASSYQFKLKDRQRIAGHSGQRLDIVPTDEYRYGHSVWLEVNSGLLLQWELTGSSGETLAKLMFTDLKMGSEVDQNELLSRSANTPRKAKFPGTGAFSQVSAGSPGWKPKSLPPGFRLASHRQKPMEQGGNSEHIVYSDGIAAVSVYIESAGQDSPLNMGLSRMGTSHAFTRESDGMLITVLGDVPAATVKKISNSLSPVVP